MIKNYLKIAIRTLARNKAFSAINVFGLAIGLSTCIIIMLFVEHELSYDRHHVNADRIVRVEFRGEVKGQHMKEASVFPPVAKTLQKDYPEIEIATRLSVGPGVAVEVGKTLFRERNIAYVDPTFFSVFTLPFQYGNSVTALANPNTIVISNKLSKKYFGDEDPTGKLLFFQSMGKHLKITGVFNDVPETSHFHFDMFASLLDVKDAESDSWMTSNYYTYLLLKPGASYKRLQQKMPAVVEKYMAPQLHEIMGITLSEFRRVGNKLNLFLQPLTRIHLHNETTNDLEPAGNINYVYIFSAIAAFMLIIACINFINLSTASAGKRAREVGIRKVMGSMKRALVWQFMTESLIITFAAVILAIVMVEMSLPLFNSLSGGSLSVSFISGSWLLPFLLVVGLITAFISGLYPAFFLASFNPIKVLKGAQITSKAGFGLRSVLVVTQFAIAVILMISTVTVYNQLHYIQNKELGYNKDQVVIFQSTFGMHEKNEPIRNKLAGDPRVSAYTASAYMPAGASYGNNFFVYEKQSGEQIKTLRYEVDAQYIPTLGMTIMEGSNFSGTRSQDSLSIIVNETAVRELGWQGPVIGRRLLHPDNSGSIKTFQVIGVVRDFHFKSLHEKISPLVMTYSENSGQLIAKVAAKDLTGVISSVAASWDKLNTGAPFTYSFLDEEFYKVYKAERNTGTIIAIFAGLTIFVACLGLFGLATYMVQQRNKEIGIRKVLGAGVWGLMVLLSRDFLKLVLIAIVVGAPVAWLLMNKWLQNFEYRESPGWWIFASVGLTAFFITIVTVSARGLRAALMNPSVVLRNE